MNIDLDSNIDQLFRKHLLINLGLRALLELFEIIKRTDL